MLVDQLVPRNSLLQWSAAPAVSVVTGAAGRGETLGESAPKSQRDVRHLSRR
jgi:hypothetical protein